MIIIIYIFHSLLPVQIGLMEIISIVTHSCPIKYVSLNICPNAEDTIQNTKYAILNYRIQLFNEID